MKINDITKTVYKIRDFLDWQKSGKLELSPSFQRRQVWKKTAKSFLIDSIVRNYPIPPILLREKANDLQDLKLKYEVVDGQQRLRTILTYIDPKSFSDFKDKDDAFRVLPYHNAAIANKNFTELPADARNQILDYQLVVHVLPSYAEDSEILEIFSRINSTGMRLNYQELRNADYAGEFKTCVYKLAKEQLARWRTWEILSESQIARMGEVELTSECVMVILTGITAKSQKAIDGVYENYDDRFPVRIEVERRFRQVMDEIDNTLGDKMIGSNFSRIVLFYALFAAFYNDMYGLKSRLAQKKANKVSKAWVEALLAKERKIESGNIPKPVENALTGQTNILPNRQAIFDFLTSTQ